MMLDIVILMAHAIIKLAYVLTLHILEKDVLNYVLIIIVIAILVIGKINALNVKIKQNSGNIVKNYVINVL